MRCVLTLMAAIVATAAIAPSRSPGQSGRRREPRLVRMSVRPAPAPRAAMQYRLLPSVLDQTPGNAAQLYYLAQAGMQRDRSLAKVHEWLEAPLSELPRERIAEVVKTHRGALRQIELAARREWCRWDLPVRTEGFGLLLPRLSEHRQLAKLLAAQIRVDIADGKHDSAIHDLQTGLAMARHMGEAPTLIQTLVGSAIARIMLNRAEELMQAPGVPNLYWALTALPRPFVDARKSVRWESSTLYLAFPQLRKLKTARLTRRQWQAATEDMAKATAALTRGRANLKPGAQDRASLTFFALVAYPRAKQYLISLGRTPEQVEAMPVQQVVAFYSLDTYDRVRDEMFKWFNVPYWQARERMRKAESEFARTKVRGDGYPFTLFIPTLSRFYFMTARLDRHIAALRCIEAVRMYAAGHDGRLPADLARIAQVPIPNDPVTGKRFGYKAVGSTITLEAPSPRPNFPAEGVRWEVTLLKK